MTLNGTVELGARMPLSGSMLKTESTSCTLSVGMESSSSSSTVPGDLICGFTINQLNGRATLLHKDPDIRINELIVIIYHE